MPMAGKLDACLFDKTGTLTTDELVPVGVFEIGSLGSKLVVGGAEKAPPKDAAAAEDPEKKLLTPMTKISAHAALVLSGCHSLVRIEGETMGDPLESEGHEVGSIGRIRSRHSVGGDGEKTGREAARIPGNVGGEGD